MKKITKVKIIVETDDGQEMQLYTGIFGNAKIDFERACRMVPYDGVMLVQEVGDDVYIKIHDIDEDSGTYQECPECHQKTLEVTAHCATCIGCGYSLCGI